MNHESKKWNITALMPLLVFFLFALCLLAVLLTGARVYRSTVQQGQARFENRTAVQYLTTRIRQADARGSLSCRSFGTAQALVIREEIGGEAYQTLVYCHDGYLRELFCAEGGQFQPRDGEAVLPVTDLAFSLEQGLVRAELLLPDGSRSRIAVQLRSGREALP